MSKPVYRVAYEEINLTGQNEYSIALDGLVIGLQLRVFSTSPEGCTYGLNKGPTWPLSSSDLPASYGGFHVNEVPAVISQDGNFNIKWNNGSVAGQGMVVVARLVPEPIKDVEVCD